MHSANRRTRLIRNAKGQLVPRDEPHIIKNKKFHYSFYDEDQMITEEDDPKLKTKEGIAFLIASALNKANSDTNVQGTLLLVAALSLLNSSNGTDQLMSVARRLAIKGSSLGNKNGRNN